MSVYVGHTQCLSPEDEPDIALVQVPAATCLFVVLYLVNSSAFCLSPCDPEAVTTASHPSLAHLTCVGGGGQPVHYYLLGQIRPPKPSVAACAGAH